MKPLDKAVHPFQRALRVLLLLVLSTSPGCFSMGWQVGATDHAAAFHGAWIIAAGDADLLGEVLWSTDFDAGLAIPREGAAVYFAGGEDAVIDAVDEWLMEAAFMFYALDAVDETGASARAFAAIIPARKPHPLGGELVRLIAVRVVADGVIERTDLGDWDFRVHRHPGAPEEERELVITGPDGRSAIYRPQPAEVFPAAPSNTGTR